MKIICPFCLTRTAEVPRCPACHAFLPSSLREAKERIPGCTELAQLRRDGAGAWLAGRRGGADVLVWVGPPQGIETLEVSPPENAVAPLESGKLEDGTPWCIWEMPERTLAAHTRMNPSDGYALWRELYEAGILNSDFEWYPFEIVQVQEKWKALSGRPVPLVPPAGTLHAPERLSGARPSRKSRVFTAAAWFLYIVSGQHPMGIPTPVSWRKINLAPIDEAVFEALRTEPSRRPAEADFVKSLERAAAGPPLAQWLTGGLLWVLGAVVLTLWAAGVVWVVTHFDLL